MQTPSLGRGTVHVGITLQLFVSHLVGGCVALGVFFAVAHTSLREPGQFLVASGAGAVVGLLLTLNIPYSLYMLELALGRFAQGFAVEKLAVAWRWPLQTLFAQVNGIAERIEALARNEHLTEDLRGKLLQQASEAAAREERERIARDLHDSIKQQIFSISISAAAAKAHWAGKSGVSQGKESAQEAVEDIQRSAKEAQVEMQALLQQLRSAPLENTSLVSALRTQAEALGYRIGARMVVEIGELPGNDRMLPGTQEAVFRMVQEAFANIARHARATTVWLSLYQKDNMLHVEVRDDGQGFDNTAKMGMGQENLRQRATELEGTMEISSAVGQGTSIHAALPLFDTLRTRQQQEEQMQHDIQRSREQAMWGFQLTENATPLAFALIVFGAPILLTIACVLAAFYGYLQAYYYRTRVALIAGRSSMEALSLQQREYNALMFLLGLCTTLCMVAFAEQQAEAFGWRWWLLLAGSCLFFGLIAVGVWWRFRGSNRYYSHLPHAELGWEIEQKKRGFGRRWRIWLIAAAAILYFGHLPTPFQAVTPRAWGTYATILGMSLFGVVILLDYVQLSHWKQVLTSKEGQEKQTETSLEGAA